MWEWLRKLTANYTEEEYREYLTEPAPADAFTRKYWQPIKGDEYFKDIACDLACVADDTGYDSGFIYEQWCEMADDLESLGRTKEYAQRKAFDYVVGISYEHDW